MGLAGGGKMKTTRWKSVGKEGCKTREQLYLFGTRKKRFQFTENDSFPPHIPQIETLVGFANVSPSRGARRLWGGNHMLELTWPACHCRRKRPQPGKKHMPHTPQASPTIMQGA